MWNENSFGSNSFVAGLMILNLIRREPVMHIDSKSFFVHFLPDRLLLSVFVINCNSIVTAESNTSTKREEFCSLSLHAPALALIEACTF